MKRLVRSERSDGDVREVVQYLLREACASVALRFIDALEESYLLLQSQPEIGRLYAPENPELQGIRSWRVHRFVCWRGAEAPPSSLLAPGALRLRDTRGQQTHESLSVEE